MSTLVNKTPLDTKSSQSTSVINRQADEDFQGFIFRTNTKIADIHQGGGQIHSLLINRFRNKAVIAYTLRSSTQ